MGKASAGNYWTTAATHFAQEQRAASHVERQGFEFYLPYTLTLLKNGREKRELMFPGYLFILVTAQWRSLMGTRGIQRLFTCGEQPSRMPEHEITGLKAREVSGFVDLAPRFAVGQKVLVKGEDGSYFSGIVQGMDARERCKVLFELLGRQVILPVDRRSMEAAV
jgi:transcriptional antiterminator RfaH